MAFLGSVLFLIACSTLLENIRGIQTIDSLNENNSNNSKFNSIQFKGTWTDIVLLK